MEGDRKTIARDASGLICGTDDSGRRLLTHTAIERAQGNPSAPVTYLDNVTAGGNFGFPRPQESYLVAVGKKVYWPRVVHLKALPPV